MVCFYIFCLTTVFFSGLIAQNVEELQDSRSDSKEQIITRDLDPRYILNAISGATTAIAQLKSEKHPDDVHPVSFLAALLHETSKLVNYNMRKEEEKKNDSRSLLKICYSNELRNLVDFLDKSQIEESHNDETNLKKLIKYTDEFSGYISKETELEKKQYFDVLYHDITRKKKLVGEVLFMAGNYLADAAQQTTEVLTKDLMNRIETNKDSIEKTYFSNEDVRSFSFLSLESQLINKVSTLVDSTRVTREGDESNISLLDQLTEVSGILREALFQDEEMLYYWQETSVVGPIIAAETLEERRDLIKECIENKEISPLFVEQLVYCIYHVVFNKLGQMLKVAYEVLQNSDGILIESENESLGIESNLNIFIDELE